MKDIKDDCSQHKKDVAGISDMKVLAEMIGDLHYETLAELLAKLCDKLHIDAAKDSANNKVNLARQLRITASHIYYASCLIKHAWQISKPFMVKS